MECRQAGWSVCLPLLIFPCTIKSRSSLLAPAHPGGSGKRAVKRLWCSGGYLLTYLLTRQAMLSVLCSRQLDSRTPPTVCSTYSCTPHTGQYNVTIKRIIDVHTTSTYSSDIGQCCQYCFPLYSRDNSFVRYDRI